MSYSIMRPFARFSLILLVVVVATVCVTSTNAAIVPPTLNWDAAADSSDQFWNSTVNPTAVRRWDFGSAATADNVSDPVLKTLTKAYDDTATMASFEGLGFGGTNPTMEDATFEFVLRADASDLMTGVKRTLLESGGDGDGIALAIVDGMLTFRVQQYNPGGGNGGVPNDAGDVLGQIMTAFPTDGNFHQVVGSIDVANNEVSLYIDGQLVNTVDTTIQYNSTTMMPEDTGVQGDLTDWAGANGSGLNSVDSSIAGLAELGGGFTDFVGDTAIVRYYRDQVLSAAEVEDNYNALVPDHGRDRTYRPRFSFTATKVSCDNLPARDKPRRSTMRGFLVRR